MKIRSITAVLGTVTLAVGLTACATSGVSGPNTGKVTPKASASTTTEAEATDDTPKVAAPKPSDFTITMKIRSKSCFGEAGCNVEVRPSFTYDGPDLAEDWDVTYSVKGDESGPQIETATVSADGTINYGPSLLSTRSSSTKITAKVVSVEPTDGVEGDG